MLRPGAAPGRGSRPATLPARAGAGSGLLRTSTRLLSAASAGSAMPPGFAFLRPGNRREELARPAAPGHGLIGDWNHQADDQASLSPAKVAHARPPACLAGNNRPARPPARLPAPTLPCRYPLALLALKHRWGAALLIA